MRRIDWQTIAVVLVLGSTLALAVVLRTSQAAGPVLGGENIAFGVGDGWYHLRLVENLIHNFPSWLTFDPFLVHPHGQRVPVAPLTPMLLAAVSLLLGLGSPSDRLVETVCAASPVVLGAVTLLPVYLLGKRLNDRTTGVLAALLLAVSPGPFLARTLLGYVDHHAAEVCLATWFSWAVVTALCPLERSTSPTEPRRRPALLFGAGLLLGTYLANWLGGSFLVVIFTAWVIIQAVLDKFMKTRSVGPLDCLLVLAVAGAIISPWRTDMIGRRLENISLLSAGAAMLALFAWGGRQALRPRFRRIARIVVLLFVTLGAVLLVLFATEPLRSLFSELRRIAPAGMHQAIPEAAPLLRVSGQWSLGRAWSYFAAALPLSMAGLIWVVKRSVRERDAAATYVAVWSFAMLAAMLFQSRFAYYYAVNASLLCACVCSWALEWLGRACDRHVASHPSFRAMIQSAGGVGVFLIVFLPCLTLSQRTSGQLAVPPADWFEAMDWLRRNSPEPFARSDYYYGRYSGPDVQTSEYGVLCPWSYGYWVIRMAHRVPIANPGQHGAEATSRFLLETDPAKATARLSRLGGRYVVLDSSYPYLEMSPGGSVVGRMASLAYWAGTPLERFAEEWRFHGRDGTWQRFMVYYPDYYRTMLARLYVLRGQPAQVRECYVMSFREREESGTNFKELVAARKFTDFAEASRFLESQPTDSTRLVGTDPTMTCAPLEAPVANIRRVFRSSSVRCRLNGEDAANVEVYEFVPGVAP